jgi:hypothetical protein
MPVLGIDELTGSVEQFTDFFEALKRISPLSISFEKITNGSKGYCNYDEHRIAIQEGMSEVQTVKTAIHEITHARLHDFHREKEKDIPTEQRKDRNTREVEAESVAYTVCQHYGIDTSEYSFGYIAGWSGGRETKELKASLELIRSTAAGMIEDIDGSFRELVQTRTLEATSLNNHMENYRYTFAIYQLKSGIEMRSYHFEPLERLQAAGLEVDQANYRKIYTAPLAATDTLEDIYRLFNVNPPSDYTGHSLSVSDIVVLHRQGKDTAYYVDSFGFSQVSQFLTPQQPPVNYLETGEKTIEQNYNMIDGHINNTPDEEADKMQVNRGDFTSLSKILTDIKGRSSVTEWAKTAPHESRKRTVKKRGMER